MEYVKLGKEGYYKISESDKMRPFFMSIVSDSNHWMFISSNGGLTAGRKNAEYALFPYYTDDKITEASEITGSKTIFKLTKNNTNWVWEPFSQLGKTSYKITRNLYKNTYGNKIIFEEINHDLQLTFSYQWCNSNTYGFVRTATIKNSSTDKIELSVLDGLQNIIPYGVGTYIQNSSSNLVDAYKRSELLSDSGLGIYALSAIIVDKAEPSEALKANVVWSLGLDNPKYLLSSLQLKDFRNSGTVQQETDVKAEKGAYFVQCHLSLAPNKEKNWQIVANVNYDHAAVFSLADQIKNTSNLKELVQKDIDLGTQKLVSLCAAADGLQKTSDTKVNSRHFSNTMFNIMRGGIFDAGYTIEKKDFIAYLKQANNAIYQVNLLILEGLPETITAQDLQKLATENGDVHFIRLCTEYLPLKFSRRHGDPSRPWNRFSINTRSEKDGSKILDYEGNWRDIFQNWEALAFSYPNFIEGMIHKFLNATTFDGYNPYRVTKSGFDWETIEPDDPWSYIGYWGDHQIIYLLKFLEFYDNLAPGALQKLFSKDVFVYANVPYKIKSYQEIIQNSKDTIDFDGQADEKIRELREKIGADGALLYNKRGEITTANFVEKLLATTLAKVSNFIPEGGIWMNTQRPEWNDANNALVGNGVSMVTLYYLRRFLAFFKPIFEGANQEEYLISAELSVFFKEVLKTLQDHKSMLQSTIDNVTRRKLMDGLGTVAATFRNEIYHNQFSGDKTNISRSDVVDFINTTLAYLEHSIRANERVDQMFHAYNLMTVEQDGGVSISYLDEMLEGQVAVLSSKYLSPNQTLKVLDALKASALFREDQYSYILYPNKNLPLFAEKNNISKEDITKSELLQKMVEDGENSLVSKSVKGSYHFNGNFKNANDVQETLDQLQNTCYSTLAKKEEKFVLALFEKVFNHKAFTGRSGTFFGYEGLGSIYWHMVSKLLLAAQECCLQAIEAGASDEIVGKLLEHYYEINEGIGVHKSPDLYGAFPTDPYSHTPAGKGAQQPGMTGQVKEDIISRFGELGVKINQNKICFEPTLLRSAEFLTQPDNFRFFNLQGKEQNIALTKGQLAFTYCQIPIVYSIAQEEKIALVLEDGKLINVAGNTLSKELSDKVFDRNGEISQIKVGILENKLR